MTNYKFLFTGILLLATLRGISQGSLDSSLARYNRLYPVERMHLHTDKQTYLPGETVWFKAYIWSDEPVSSTNLFTDVMDADGRVVKRLVSPIFEGTADGHFVLPDSAATAAYLFRSYTSVMLNHDSTNTYQKYISVFKEGRSQSVRALPPASLQFFAEGGNLLAGVFNTVAFKATTGSGLPFEVTGAIKNAKLQLIDSFYSRHNGMGLFKFIPEAGEKYFAEWKDANSVVHNVDLPEVQAQGIALHAEQLKTDLYYYIAAGTGNAGNVKVLATMFQKPVYQATLKAVEKTAVVTKFSTADFPSGILQLTVFNADDQPLAERIVFINNHNYATTAEISLKEKNLQKRGKNTVLIDVKDSATTNLSLSVYDMSFEDDGYDANIFTDLLLTGDLKGYVHQPGIYFTPGADPKSLDLVMQTNGWRRYNWQRILAPQIPFPRYPKDNYLSLTGRVVNAKQELMPLTNISLTLDADSAKQWYLSKTNEQGIFRESGIVFTDTAQVYYKVVNSKSPGFVGLSPLNGLPSLQPGISFVTPEFVLHPQLQEKSLATISTSARVANAEFERKAKSLAAVVVVNKKSLRRAELLKMDQKYNTRFRGNSGPAVDVLNDPEAENSTDIYNYLYAKLPGLTVVNKGFQKTFTTIRGETPLIFVNEQQVDADYLGNINMSEVAYVRYIDRVASAPGLPPGVAIYLRKAGDVSIRDGKGLNGLPKMKILGYSPVKEFYAPDYDMPDERHLRPDMRTTLHWQPYLLSTPQNQRISLSFFNNDFSTRLKIVLEGMNTDGKLIHVEKIVE
ncbi:MAG: hypothetical protein JWQ27_2573 [Ferruginibacter sp.]|nr:hypothetical protein [Ferruginibacter sp.]